MVAWTPIKETSSNLEGGRCNGERSIWENEEVMDGKKSGSREVRVR